MTSSCCIFLIVSLSLCSNTSATRAGTPICFVYCSHPSRCFTSIGRVPGRALPAAAVPLLPVGGIISDCAAPSPVSWALAGPSLQSLQTLQQSGAYLVSSEETKLGAGSGQAVGWLQCPLGLSPSPACILFSCHQAVLSVLRGHLPGVLQFNSVLMLPTWR